MRVPWNEDMRVKFPATVQFMRLGYEYQSLKDADIHPETRIFLNRFVPAIQRINSDKNLTVEQILATIEEIHNIIKNNDMGKEFLSRLLDQTADIKLIDFDHPADNDFAIVDELTFGPEAKGSFRPDVTVLVNGIPLGFLEVKKPNNEGGIQKEFHRICWTSGFKYQNSRNTSICSSLSPSAITWSMRPTMTPPLPKKCGLVPSILRQMGTVPSSPSSARRIRRPLGSRKSIWMRCGISLKTTGIAPAMRIRRNFRPTYSRAHHAIGL